VPGRRKETDASRLKDPQNFLKGCFDLGDVLVGCIGKNGIKIIIRKWQKAVINDDVWLAVELPKIFANIYPGVISDDMLKQPLSAADFQTFFVVKVPFQYEIPQHRVYRVTITLIFDCIYLLAVDLCIEFYRIVIDAIRFHKDRPPHVVRICVNAERMAQATSRSLL